METWGFTLYKNLRFWLIFDIFGKGVPYTKQQFVFTTSKLKTQRLQHREKSLSKYGLFSFKLKVSNIVGKRRKNSKSPVQETACKKQSLQYKGKS